MVKRFPLLLVHAPPSAAGAWEPPTACLSQHAWKLAGEEVHACANYILIIGNVLANQGYIAILEPSAPLCMLGMRARMSSFLPSWTPHPAPQLDVAACLAHYWVETQPYYLWEIEKYLGEENGDLCHAYSKIPHTSCIHLFLAPGFTPTHHSLPAELL